MVFFEDHSLRIPLVRTLKYLRKGKSDDGVDMFLFSELSAMGEPHKTFVRVADAHDLLDGEGLVSALERCFAGRSASPR